ncbi:hypothetical protein [uncultured Aquimarina sp.]|uniref:hypothetical protein n=1 Tax=uncultured Aquimarina sp. TaxID=575652 RepID=UPI00260D757D|nr:hypothetical protein [uncultured Aquimarina sp.]
MLSKILELKNVEQLDKKQQKGIKGGTIQYPIGCQTRRDCFIVTGEFDWSCEIAYPYALHKICKPL